MKPFQDTFLENLPSNLSHYSLLGWALDRSYLLLCLCKLTLKLLEFDEKTLTFTRSRRQLCLEVFVLDEDSLGRPTLLPSLLQVLLYKHVLLLQYC